MAFRATEAQYFISDTKYKHFAQPKRNVFLYLILNTSISRNRSATFFISDTTNKHFAQPKRNVFRLYVSEVKNKWLIRLHDNMMSCVLRSVVYVLCIIWWGYCVGDDEII